MRSRKGQPPRHGQVIVGGMKRSHMAKHLAAMMQHANETRDYGAHGTGFRSGGSFSPGGASGADYQTTSVNDTPDADSQGPVAD